MIYALNIKREGSSERTPKEHIMKRRSTIILLVLVFLFITVGLFARGGYRFDSYERPYAAQQATFAQSPEVGEFLMDRQMVRQQLHTPGEDCPLGEDCPYLLTGELQYRNQDVNQAAAGQRAGGIRGGRAR